MAVCDGTIFPATGTSANTRTGVQSFLGQPLPVSWVEIEEVDPPATPSALKRSPRERLYSPAARECGMQTG